MVPSQARAGRNSNSEEVPAREGQKEKGQRSDPPPEPRCCSLILLAPSGIPGYPEPSGPTGKGRGPGAWGAPSSSDLVPEFSGHFPVHGWGRSRFVSAQFAPPGVRLLETVTGGAWERWGGAWPAGGGGAGRWEREAPVCTLSPLSDALQEQVAAVCACGWVGGWLTLFQSLWNDPPDAQA